MSNNYSLLPKNSSDGKSGAVEPFASSIWGDYYVAADVDGDFRTTILQLRSCFHDDPKIWEMIDRARKLSHDLYVSVRALVKENNWIVLERRGEPVRELIKNGPLPQSCVRQMFAQTLDLLAYFEKNGFVHGDISPDSFLLPPDVAPEIGKDKRIYFKLAFSLGASLEGGVPTSGKRNVKYVAPEMVNSDFGKVSSQTDLYLLGFTMFELLVGPRFDKRFERINMNLKSTWVYWHGNAGEELPAPRALVPNIAPDLERALSAVLCKKTSERAKTASEVLEMLDLTRNDEADERVVAPNEADKDASDERIVRETVSNWGAGVAEEPVEKFRWNFDWKDKNAWIKLAKKPYVVQPASALVVVWALTTVCATVFPNLRWTSLALNLEPKSVQIFKYDGKKLVDDVDYAKGGTLPVGKRVRLAFQAENYITTVDSFYVNEDGTLMNMEKRNLNGIKLNLTKYKISFDSKGEDQPSKKDIEFYCDGEQIISGGERYVVDAGVREFYAVANGYKPALISESDALDVGSNDSYGVKLDGYSDLEEKERTFKETTFRRTTRNESKVVAKKREFTLKLLYAIPPAYYKDEFFDLARYDKLRASVGLAGEGESAEFEHANDLGVKDDARERDPALSPPSEQRKIVPRSKNSRYFRDAALKKYFVDSYETDSDEETLKTLDEVQKEAVALCGIVARKMYEENEPDASIWSWRTKLDELCASAEKDKNLQNFEPEFKLWRAFADSQTELYGSADLVPKEEKSGSAADSKEISSIVNDVWSDDSFKDSWEALSYKADFAFRLSKFRFADYVDGDVPEVVCNFMGNACDALDDACDKIDDKDKNGEEYAALLYKKAMAECYSNHTKDARKSCVAADDCAFLKESTSVSVAFSCLKGILALKSGFEEELKNAVEPLENAIKSYDAVNSAPMRYDVRETFPHKWALYSICGKVYGKAADKDPADGNLRKKANDYEQKANEYR